MLKMEVKNGIKKIDVRLITYVFIVLLKQFSYVFFPSNIISYLLIVALIFLFLTEKKENFLPVILFFHPCAALFDDVNFTYIFNFTIVIFALKQFVLLYKQKLFTNKNKKLLILLVLIVCYEIILTLANGFLDAGILSLVSWISSYIFVITYMSVIDKPDVNKMLKYFYYGFVAGAIGGYAIPYSIYGIDFPSKYRFMGLFRDPNVYSLDALLIIFTSLKIKKRLSIMTIVTITLGCFSVSKMFLLVLLLGMGLHLIINLKTIKAKEIIKVMPLVVIACVIGIRFNFFTTIYDKYIDRIDVENISTGRTEIIEFYLGRLYDKPLNLIFGSSDSNYRLVLQDNTQKRSLYETHNTYLELLVAWGILGTTYYLIYIEKIIEYIKNKYNKYEMKIKYSFPLIFSFLLAIFSLAYLSADIFAILILFIVLVTYIPAEMEDTK